MYKIKCYKIACVFHGQCLLQFSVNFIFILRIHCEFQGILLSTSTFYSLPFFRNIFQLLKPIYTLLSRIALNDAIFIYLIQLNF